MGLVLCYRDPNMTSSAPATSSGDHEPEQRIGTLDAFTGSFIPGVCFESGYCIWLLEFTSTPPPLETYTELWVITPDDERVLYTDPGGAAEEVIKYHDFDRTEEATINSYTSPNQVSMTMEAGDGTSLELSASVNQTPEVRVLNTIIALTPQAILQSPVGTTISTNSLNHLLDTNGMKVAGETETGRRYRLAADRIYKLSDATATLDAQDLGSLRSPDRPIEFGDAKTTAEALYIPGTLHLERFSQPVE